MGAFRVTARFGTRGEEDLLDTGGHTDGESHHDSNEHKSRGIGEL